MRMWDGRKRRGKIYEIFVVNGKRCNVANLKFLLTCNIIQWVGNRDEYLAHFPSIIISFAQHRTLFFFYYLSLHSEFFGDLSPSKFRPVNSFWILWFHLLLFFFLFFLLLQVLSPLLYYYFFLNSPHHVVFVCKYRKLKSKKWKMGIEILMVMYFGLSWSERKYFDIRFENFQKLWVFSHATACNNRVQFLKSYLIKLFGLWNWKIWTVVDIIGKQFSHL